MTEIQGKSILVRVSARFELARVRVIGSRLYILVAFLLLLRRANWSQLNAKKTVELSISQVMLCCTCFPLDQQAYTLNHNHNKILKSDWLSTAPISALIGQLNRTVRAIRRSLKWLFFTASKKNLGISCVLIKKRA